jgi:hypothetical protein
MLKKKPRVESSHSKYWYESDSKSLNLVSIPKNQLTTIQLATTAEKKIPNVVNHSKIFMVIFTMEICDL